MKPEPKKLIECIKKTFAKAKIFSRDGYRQLEPNFGQFSHDFRVLMICNKEGENLGRGFLNV